MQRKIVIFNAVWILKKSFYTTCYCSTCWSNIRSIYRLTQNIWYRRWFSIAKKSGNFWCHYYNFCLFWRYLNGRKQYTKIIECGDTVKQDIRCVVPQGSIIGPLLFLLYANDLPNSSNVLVPMVFVEDTNLFFVRSNISTFFKTVNDE